MKRALAIVVTLVVAVSIWAVLSQRPDRLDAQLAAVEQLETPADRVDGAVLFIERNPEADPTLLARAVRLALESAGLEMGEQGAIHTADLLLELDLPSEARYAALAGLTSSLIAVGGEENIDRARRIADEFAGGSDIPNDSFLTVAIRHYVSETLDPPAMERLIFAGYRERTPETAETWHALIDATYRRRLTTVRDARGTEAALAAADSLMAEAPDGVVSGILHAMIYQLAVEEMPDRALAAARDLLASTELENSGTLNSVAYDMATRGLEPPLAVELADRALAFAATKYDSMNLLDTAGWARFAARDYEGAVERLEAAFALDDASPSLESVVVRHLLEAYEAGGMRDARIDLLTLVAARSVVDADTAREMLSPLLIDRDGTDARMNAIIDEHRYEGVVAAAPFTLPDRSGVAFSSEEHRGEILLVCFWSYG